jgi:hypothetical protein
VRECPLTTGDAWYWSYSSSIPSGRDNQRYRRAPWTETVGCGNEGSANAPIATAIESGHQPSLVQKTVAPQSGQKRNVRSSPASEMRTYSVYRPVTATRSFGQRACIPKALPVRRWQARQ